MKLSYAVFTQSAQKTTKLKSKTETENYNDLITRISLQKINMNTKSN